MKGKGGGDMIPEKGNSILEGTAFAKAQQQQGARKPTGIE